MIRLLTGDALAVLRTLPDESVHCVVCSPPYWRLRDYGVAGQLGLESSPEDYVAKMVEVFREVRRILRKDGTCWMNMGDSYAGGKGKSGVGSQDYQDERVRTGKSLNRVQQTGGPGRVRALDDLVALRQAGLKSKDLCGIPWRLAFALQADGWWLRQDIIWAKPNPMPESVTDRCTKAHEYIFLLSKSARYYYDAEAVKEPGKDWGTRERKPGSAFVDGTPGRTKQSGGKNCDFSNGRNLRSVWTMTTQPFAEAHFATFPEELPRRCIRAGTSEKGCCPTCGKPWVRVVEKTNEINLSAKGSRFDKGKTGVSGAGRTQEGERFANHTLGWRLSCTCGGEPVPCTCLDPFGGSGTVGLVADQLGRNAILIELKPEYADMAERRIRDASPMFVEIGRR